jgi:hypothetical protein
MNHWPSLFVCGCLLSTGPLPAQTPPPTAPAAPAVPYEAPPSLRADAIFPANLLTGVHYRVRSTVETQGGVNRFTIDSDEGVFTADGNEMLIERLREINAIYQLRHISKGDEYKSALKTAATAPLDLAKGIVKQPRETVQGVAKGAWKLMNRAGEGIKGAVSGRERTAYEESAGRDLIGFSKVKRNLAFSMGVDPYSRNTVLQQILDEVAWTSFAGKMTFTAALMPLGGAAGAVATGTGVGTTLTSSIRDNSPADLRLLNTQQLTALGIPPALVQSFVENPAFSPAHQTLMTQALTSLRGVEGLDALLDLTRSCADEDDALFFQRTTELIAWVHTTQSPLSRMVSLNGFPVCLTRDGSVLVALHLDYAIWSPVTDRFIQALLHPQNLTPKGFKVMLSGSVSPTLRQQLEARNIALAEKLSPVLTR